MTKKRWTTPEQRTYLASLIPSFVNAQQLKTTSTVFYPQTYKEWRKRWPTPSPTQEEKEEWGAKAEDIKERLIERQVFNWFHNNTRTAAASTSTASSRSMLKLIRKKRMLAPWQAYQSLYYEKKLKVIVDKEWSSYLAQLPEGVEPEKTRFEIITKVAIKEFESEGQDVKDEVENYRRKQQEEPEDQDDAARNEGYARAIKKLPRTITAFGESINLQAGWNVVILCGGPNVSLNGKITSFVQHFGNNKQGQDFKDWLGDCYESTLLEPFDEYLYDCFPQEECEARCLTSTSKENSPIVVDGSDDSANDESEVESGPPTDKSTRTYKKSQYEQERDRNIARNKETLRQLEAEFSHKNPDADLQLQPHPTPQQKRKKKEKSVGKQPVDEDSRRRSQRTQKGSRNITTSTNGKISEDSATNKAGDSSINNSGEDTAAKGFDKRRNGTTKSNIGDTTTKSNANDTSRGNANDTTKNNSIDNGGSKKIGSNSTNQAGDEGNADEKGGNGPTDTGGNLDNDTTNPGSHGTTNEGEDDTTINDNLEGCNTNDKGDGAAGTDTPNEGHDGTVDKGATSGSLASADNIQGGSIGCETEDNDQDMSRDVSIEPGYELLPEYAQLYLGYLRDVSEDSKWQELVTQWRDFESRHPPVSNLSTTARPEEISWWIKRHKQPTLIPKVKPATFGAEWINWYTSLQPDWRNGSANELSRDAPDNEDWASLLKGGSLGLCSIVMALSWWLKSLAPAANMDKLWAAVDDLHWVLYQITDTLPSITHPVNRKRQRTVDNIDNKPKSKRSRTSK